MSMRLALLPTLLFTLAACRNDKSSDDAHSPTPGNSGPEDTSALDTADSGDPEDSGGTEPEDNDGDGVFSDIDCNDDDPDVHPGAPEWVDGIDSDCDPATTEAGRATWYGSSGPVDVSTDLDAAWTAPEDGRLALGEGDWSAHITVPTSIFVEVRGYGAVVLGASGAEAMRVDGDGTLSNLALAGSVRAGLGATLTATQVDFGTGELSAYQGARLSLSDCAFDGASRSIQGVDLGGSDPAPRTLQVVDSTVSATYAAITGFEDVTVTNSTVHGESYAITSNETLVVESATLSSPGIAVTVGRAGGGVAVTATVLNTEIAGYNGIHVYPDSSLELSDSQVSAEHRALSVTGGTATVTGSTLSTTGQQTVSLDGRDGALVATFAQTVFTGAADRHIVGSFDVTLTMEDCTLSDASLGAVKLQTDATSTSAFRRNTFANNSDTHTGSGTYGNGAALSLVGGDHTFELQDNVFDANTAAKDGGAVYLSDTTAALSGNTFTANTARSGGAIYVDGNVTFTSTADTFTDNTAIQSGGAVSTPGSSISFSDVQMFRNQASVGGAISAGPLGLSGSWDLGTGADDNTPDDYHMSCSGFTDTIGSGSGNLNWRGTPCY